MTSAAAAFDGYSSHPGNLGVRSSLVANGERRGWSRRIRSLNWTKPQRGRPAGGAPLIKRERHESTGRVRPLRRGPGGLSEGAVHAGRPFHTVGPESFSQVQPGRWGQNPQPGIPNSAATLRPHREKSAPRPALALASARSAWLLAAATSGGAPPSRRQRCNAVHAASAWASEGTVWMDHVTSTNVYDAR